MTKEALLLKLRSLGGICSAVMLFLPAASFASVPSITNQPQSTNVLAGANARFSVTAIGSPTPGYQWSFNGVNLVNSTHIRGARGTTLTVSNVTAADAGNYRVGVANSYGGVVSSNATLTVLFPPAITVQPHGRTVFVGAQLTLSAAATGTQPLGYQWRFNGANLNGATNTTLVLANLQTNQSGNYSLRASNAVGVAVSSNAVVIVSTTPDCTAPPSGLVSWWQGEGNAADVTGTNNGALSAAGASYTNGLVGQAFRFDGTNGYIQIPDSPSLKPANVTVEAWVWLDPNLPATNGGEDIVFKKNTWSAWFEGYCLMKDTVHNGDGSLSDRFQFVVSRSGNQVIIDSQTIAQRGVWYHVAATYDGNQSTLYVNGVAEASATPGFALDYDTTPVFIGTSGTWPPYLAMFGGIIDEPAIYNRAMSSNEIAAIYFAGNGGKCVSSYPPVIVTQPQGQLVFPGAQLTLSAAATGAQPVSYQWLFNGTGGPGGSPLAGATNATLVLTNLQFAQSGNYSLQASNRAGVAVSSNAPVTVNFPVNGLVLWNTLGSDTEVSNSVYGPNLQKYTGGSGVDVPANTAYAPGQFGNAVGIGPGSYISEDRVHNLVLNNLAQCINPNRGTIDVWFKQNSTPAPYVNGVIRIFDGAYGLNSGMSFHSLPPPNNLELGLAFGGATTAVNYDITASNGLWLNLAGVWDVAGIDGSADKLRLYVNGQLVAASTTATWGTTVGPQADIAGGQDNNCAGQFFVDNLKVFNRALTANEVAQIYRVGEGFTNWPPTVTLQPQSQTVVAGSNVTFSVVANGLPPPNYQWYLNGAALTNDARHGGVMSSNLTIVNLQAGDIGNYQVAVTNSAGSVTSSVASLTVLFPPAITLQPVNRTLPQGSNVTFNAVASGAAPLMSQWFFNGNPLADGGQFSGSTTTNLAISNLQFTNGGNYVLVVTNLVGSAASTAAVLTVLTPPIIVQQPADLTAQWGASAMFSVAVIGTTPLNYQWTFNGATLNDATNSMLLLTNVQPSQAGTYAVAITNTIGSVISSNAALTVGLPPPGVPFITGFSPLTAYPGATVTISGTNFNSVAGSNTVYFGAVQAEVFSASVTNLTVAVPVGATFGPVTETVGGLVAYSDQLFEPTFPGNGSNITVSSFAPGFNLGTAVNPGSAVIADLDGDGKPDIALVSGGSHVVCIFRNISTNGALLGPASFAARVDLPFPAIGTGGNPYRLRAVDLDGDGRLDLMAEEAGGNRVSIFHNIATPGSLTTNSFEPAFSLAAGNDCRFATAADLDGDGRPDIVALNYGDKTISIFQNIGAAGILTSNSFASSVVLPAPGGPYEVVIADLDGDGKPDLAVANQDNNTVSIYQNFATPGVIATNSFAPRLDLPGDTNPDTLAAVDMDGDGELDLVVGAVHSETIAVYRNTSSPGLLTTNSFAPLVDSGTSDWTHTVAVADFNGDGKPDITVVGELPSIMSIFQNVSTPGSFASSSFLPRVDFTTGWNAWGVAAGDLDGDGRPDIIFCNDYDNTLTIYQNQVPFGGPPVIIAQPGNQTVPLNNTAQLAGTAMGQSPMGYQWFFNGTNLTDNGRVSGSATGVLTNTNALLSDSGNYWFVVTNSLGSTTSSVAALSVVILPPTFAPQPQSQAAILGSNATFTAGVSGSLPITFQWFSDNGILSDDGHFSGTATAALTVGGVQASDAVNYWLVASNAAGAATSSVVNLTIVLPVVITQSPLNQTNAAGSTFALTTAATGSGPFGYQWYFNNSLLADNSRISGSATSSLTISNAQTSDTGNYFAVVTNLLTAATSSVAAVTVLTPSAVTTQPLGRSTPLGLTNIFAAAASGAAPLTYQWRLNGADIPGATNTSYFIAATGTNDLGVYQFVASNAVGVAVSSNASLTIGPVAVWGYNIYNLCLVPPGLSNVTAIAGGVTYNLASRVDGSFAAWGSANGITNSSWTNVTAVSASAGGALALRSDGSVVGSRVLDPLASKVFPSNVVAVAAGNSFGLALRAEGTVLSWGYYSPGSVYSPLSPPPGLTKVTAISAGYSHGLALRSDGTVVAWGTGAATNVPIGLSNVVAVAAGSGHSLALKSDGTLVAWGVGTGTNIPAGLSNVMAIAAANAGEPNQSGGNVSSAVLSNGTVVAWGSSPYNQTNVPAGLSHVVAVANSSYVSLALVNDGSPQILRQPAGGTAWSGRDWTLQVVAAGAAPLSYQWLLNSTNIPGATNANLGLPAIQSGGAGNYQVVVSNSLGVATSLAAPITVMDSRPFFLTQPVTNLPVYLGSRVALQTAVAGSGPLQYQWQLNSNNLEGATNDTLNFDRVHMTDAGSYTLIASNSFGAVTSAVINLTVQQLVVWGSTINGVTNMPPGLTNVAAISANFYGNIALRQDGTVRIWGNGSSVPTNTVAGISNVVEVSAGYFFNLVLQANGKPFVWGSNLTPAFSNAVVNQSNIVAVEAGNGSCALLKSDGSVVWINFNGVVAASPVNNWTNVISVEPFDDGVIALRADGTVSSVNGGASPPPTLTNVLTLASARYQGLAVKRDGKIQDWPQSLLPAGTSNIIAVATAGINLGPEFAVRADGTIMTGGLGIATNVPYGLAKVWRLDAGYNHCLALLADRDFPPVFLHNALNTSSFVVSSKGGPQWFGETNISHDGVSAAQSAPIGINLSSSMRMWVAGPVTVQFWWKVSSSANHGILSFSAGGTVLTNISGEVDWQQCTVSVPAGNQILQWTYAKDGAAAAGQDAAWVDQLQFIALLPVISTQPASQNVVGPTNVVLNVGVSGTPPLTYLWWKDGSLVPGANAASLVLLNAVRTNSGTYWVVVTNAADSVISSNAVLDVRVPQLLSAPVFQPDGSILLNSTDLGGGLLSSADLANLQVQVSTNLVDWLTLSNALVLTNGAIQLQDAGATNSPMRFYRILENW